MERANSGAAASSSGAKGKYFMKIMGCQMNLAVRHTPSTLLVSLCIGTRAITEACAQESRRAAELEN